MNIIDGILFEPVGCLAEFPSDEFDQIALLLFSGKLKPSQSGSQAYWRSLNLMQSRTKTLDDSDKKIFEDLEMQAVERATAYEDVVPAVSELKGMGVKLAIASSLSHKAVARFVERFSLQQLFAETWDRDNAGGIKAAPLTAAMQSASLKAEQTMFLTDTGDGLKVAKSVGVNSILMMNDPDEAMRLAAHTPSGGIVSLHELPDFIRFIAAENAR